MTMRGPIRIARRRGEVRDAHGAHLVTLRGVLRPIPCRSEIVDRGDARVAGHEVVHRLIGFFDCAIALEAGNARDARAARDCLRERRTERANARRRGSVDRDVEPFRREGLETALVGLDTQERCACDRR